MTPCVQLTRLAAYRLRSRVRLYQKWIAATVADATKVPAARPGNRAMSAAEGSDLDPGRHHDSALNAKRLVQARPDWGAL
jgi:hypothetical protein